MRDNLRVVQSKQLELKANKASKDGGGNGTKLRKPGKVKVVNDQQMLSYANFVGTKLIYLIVFLVYVWS